MQRVMVVRNLLAVIPFLAIAAARGAVVIGELLGTKEDTPAIQWRRANWWSAASTGLLVVALCQRMVVDRKRGKHSGQAQRPLCS